MLSRLSNRLVSVVIIVGLALAAASAVSAAKGDAPRRNALVIGNADYNNQPLRNAAKDARAMRTALNELGFDVILVENATSKAMQKAILEFGERLSGGGAGVFYYAGHGLQVRGINYLLPIDEKITSESSVRFEATPLDAVLEEMSQPRPNRVNIVILDACRNNPYASRFGGTATGLTMVDAPTDFIIAYATAPGRVAADGDGALGLYTGELLKAMAIPNLQIEDMFKRVRAAVSERTGNAQVPWEASSLISDFRFLAPDAVPAKPTAVAQLQPYAGQDQRGIRVERQSNDAEIVFWESVKDSDNAADYEAYLQAFPNGVFAPLARARSRRLQQQPVTAPAAGGSQVPATAPAARGTPAEATGAPAGSRPAGPAANREPQQTTVVPHAVPTASPVAATSFRDCPTCPIMVPLPAGTFMMGERDDASAQPQHRVTIATPFALGATEVTYKEWMACVAAGGCSYTPSLPNPTDATPVRNVSWSDAQEYVRWLAQATNRPYRLPTEAEWEFGARANTSQRYWWGDAVGQGRANCSDCGGSWTVAAPADAGSYPPNPFGLYDMNGGVWEWVADCWRASYAGASSDGSARDEPNCRQRVLRGGSWLNDSSTTRSGYRFYYDYYIRYSGNGLRVALTLK